jgi:hypothetical protein
MANFPDPDGFLELLTPGQAFDGELKEVLELKEEINNARFVLDKNSRLEKYSEALKKFENHFLIIPFSRVTLPLIHQKEVNLPDTNYKYEADLRKIFWNISK